MKILLLADIHSNWQALSVIKEEFDICLFAGDLVDYGTDPIPCINWIREYSTTAIRGNHDHAVSQRVSPKTGNGFRKLAAAARPYHWKVLQSAHMDYLTAMPVTRQVTLESGSFYLVHGSPRDPLDEYIGPDARVWVHRLENIHADYVIVGHSHIPFHLDLGRTQLINPGSVGQPRDGDPRLSYALIDNGRIELKRCEYDIAAAVDQMRESGIDGEAMELAEYVLKTGNPPSSANGG